MAKPNMAKEKVPMPEQPAEVRNKNFEEVTLGYTKEQAMEEASRCLNCRHKPCVTQCPVSIDIPKFIMHIAKDEMEEAYITLSESSALPAVCGRVCPQETQCEGMCVRGKKGEPVGIGRLERFAADYQREHNPVTPDKPEPNGKKVAVIGAGPAGLAAAGDLAKLGYLVTIFEALHTAGGVLVYGIPEFRLPKSIVEAEIQTLIDLGVEIKTNMVIGKILTIDELFEDGYQAIFIGSGAGLPNFMKIKGEGLKGVFSANEYLTRVNLMKAYEKNSATPIMNAKKIAVIGGGNVAMDAARSAKRMGASEVYIIYRRGMEELPARLEEIHHAQEEGIIFKTLTNPTEILGNEYGFVSALKCVEMELGEPDASGRRRPIIKENSEHTIAMDAVIMSIGTSPNPLIISTTSGLESNKWGCIVASEDTGITSREGVFAGGDAVTGAATVILAMGSGKNAAKSIHKYLNK
ncbi:MAG: glutamate synthase (NADPH), homotetrameric [Epulopiscium sp. Nele67-Bin005]|nr:MAG: glutamate synthase (NADPH), homotetrameric [Epulopiscium sp. Nele67-Bin005]